MTHGVPSALEKAMVSIRAPRGMIALVTGAWCCLELRVPVAWGGDREAPQKEGGGQEEVRGGMGGGGRSGWNGACGQAHEMCIRHRAWAVAAAVSMTAVCRVVRSQS